MESTTAAPKSSSFAGDVFKLASGTALAQGLLVVASPLLSRLYSPGDFGVLALYVSITSIVVVIAGLRYELAIMLPESDEEAANLLALSLGFSLVTACLTCWVCVGWGKTGLDWLHAPGLQPYLLLIPVTVLLDGAFQALTYWNSRTQQFGRLSIARVTSSAAAVAAQLGAGYAGHATGGSLIGASVAGKTLSTAALGGQIWRDDRRIFRKSIRWRALWRSGIRYEKFPLINTWAGLLNVASYQSPILLFTYFFSPAIVGNYAFGFRVLFMPLGLISGSISQVFYQRAAAAYAQGNLPSLVEHTFRILITLGLFPTLLLALIGREVFSLCFGPDWGEAGRYTQILSVWAFSWFISAPLSTVFMILECHKLAIFFQFVLFLTRFLSILIGGLLNNVYVSLWLFSSTGVFVFGLLAFLNFWISGVPIRKVLYFLAGYSSYSAPGLLIILALKYAGVSTSILISTAVVFLGVHFCFLCHQYKPAIRNLFRL